MMQDILDKLNRMKPEELEAIKKEVAEATKHMKWIPNPGPQTDAFLSKADILLYGGAAGGGKTDLILGLALTQHHKTLIFRRRYADLGGITDRAIQINKTRDGFTAAPRPKMKTTDGRYIEFGACQNLGDEQSWQGQPHDLLVFDEAVQFLEEQVRFLSAWNRPSGQNSKQRTRIILASNPPIGSQGQWIIEWFGPWLNPKHPSPAKPGELRWYITNEHGKSIEVKGPKDTRIIDGKETFPLSRTFIPAKLKDNPYQDTAAYRATLDSLREPLRSALRDGNFMLAAQDDPWQVIPTQWIREAQARWKPAPPEDIPMCAIGVDVAQGGDAETTLACRYDYWFAPIIAVEGRHTPRSQDVAALVLAHRRDNASIVLDMGGGYGGGVYDHLKNNGIDPVSHKGVEGSKKRTADGQLGFTNKRSEVWWKFREALDPSQPGGSPIALPDDPKLVADLTAPLYEITPNGIKLESKDDVCKKLARSTDHGDAVVQAWSSGNKGMNYMGGWRGRNGKNLVSINGGGGPKVVLGYPGRRK